MLEASSIVSGLQGRYAIALYELARDRGALEAVAGDLAALKRAIDGSADLKRLLRSPVYSRDVQGKAFGAILDRMRLSDLVKNFIGVIAKNRRLFALPEILAAFTKLSAHMRGEVSASVSSARALSERQMQSLKAGLRTALGREVAITSSVDPELLGGMVVRVGSIMVDSSFKSQLARLQVTMREAS